jgi:CPA2 family monovalent cation:H+ antiporter-2
MHLPQIIRDLGVILGVAAIVTFIFRRIRQPVVLGYIASGIIVGPYTPAIFSVKDTVSIKTWAELGVIFLMFTLGLEFSFRRLARVGLPAGFTALIQILFMFFLGFFATKILGWSPQDGLFLGCMISISSTTIILKAFEELKLKTKKFADLVFGILIVEDLAAILMLVALTNIATTSQVGGTELLIAGGKLLFVVSVWFITGIFLVPPLIKAVGKHGNDEMLVVVSMGLCLTLVIIAANFQYSVALGAFMMGSILAETTEAKRIEHLVSPIKDVFGAVFFVSVGMLLNPATIVENIDAVALISFLIIAGKILAVSLGALISGQTIKTAIQTGFSMAQIGEFSFIIASLGLTYQSINEKIYPIIVATSLITTFTTPYLVKMSPHIAQFFENFLPKHLKVKLENYGSWIQRKSATSHSRKHRLRRITAWCLNAIIVITAFLIGSKTIYPMIQKSIRDEETSLIVSWLIAFTLSAPSIWAMASVSKNKDLGKNLKIPIYKQNHFLISRFSTISLVGMLSLNYFPAMLTMLVTLSLCGALFFVFRHQFENYYHWLENQFRSNFQADMTSPQNNAEALGHLAPWDAHLVEIKVPPRCFLVGKSLLTLNLREKYGVNIVVLIRDHNDLIAPMPHEILYPGDQLLCFATDTQMELFEKDIGQNQSSDSPPFTIGDYRIQCFTLSKNSPMIGASIKTSGIGEKFRCIVVGIERASERIVSPRADTILHENDILWIVGDTLLLEKLGATIV